ncbi:MAG: AsmA-like C-terminal domain-containing protein, partial [Acidobacteria bacterium]|nr:AsmA-like C-terminal domain-containing protein [Acidobacteriota bacterium]
GVDLYLPSLVRGEVTPEAVSLKGLHLAAIRETDGKLSLGIGGKTASGTGPTADGSAWLQSWLDPEIPGPLRRLHRVQVVNASLSVKNQALGRTWGANDLMLDVERTSNGLDTSLRMMLELAGSTTPLSVTASYASADHVLEAHLELAGLAPSAVADIAPALEPLRGIDLTADASVDLVIHKGWEVEVSAFEVRTDAGTVSGTVDAREPKQKIAGTIEIRDLRPNVLASEVPQLDILSGVDIVVDGHADFELTQLDRLSISVLQLGFSDREQTASSRAERPHKATGHDLPADDLGSLTAHEVTVDLGAGDISGQVTVEKLNPSLLAQHIDVLKPAAGLRFPIDATVTAKVEAGQPRTVEFSLRAGSGFVDIPAPVARAQQLESATIEGRLDGLETLTISRGSLDLGGGFVIELRSDVDLTGRVVGITADADIAKLAVDRIGELWPGAVADGVRVWITGHISSGAVEDIHAELELGDTGAGFGLRRLAGRFAYAGLRLELFPQASPIEGITGSASFSQSRLDFELAGAQIEDLRVTGGTVIISNLDDPPTQLRVDATVEGSASTALALVNGEPLALVDPLIIAAADVSGTNTTRLRLALPLDGPSSGTVQSLEVDSKIQDFAWSKPVFGPPTTKGELSLHVTPAGLTVSGTSDFGSAPATIDYDEYFSDSDLLRRVIINGEFDREALQSLGIPAAAFLEGAVGVDVTYTTDREGRTKVDGSVDLEQAGIDIPEIAWHKPPGAAGRLTASASTRAGGGWLIDPIRLSADGIRAEARLELADAPLAFSSFDLVQFQHGRSDFSGRATATPGGGFEIRIKGATFDLEPVVSSMKGRPAPDPGSAKKEFNIPPVDLEIHLDQLLGRDQISLSGLAVNISYDGATLQHAELSVGIGSSGHLSAVTSISSGRRTAKVEVDGVGAVMGMLHVGPYFDGGTLTLVGDESAASGQFTTQLEMRDLKITKAPAFAQLLRAASMEGLLSTFTSKGITINRLRSELVFEDRRLKVSDLTIHADGVGITADGVIDVGERTVDFEGSLAAAATLQRAIGKIPLLGQVLTGVNREGIIATQFSIKGPFDEPAVKAKPLSTLTPGITRDLMRLKPSDKSAQPTPVD